MLAKEAIDFRTNTGEVHEKGIARSHISAGVPFSHSRRKRTIRNQEFEIGGQFSRINFDSSPISLSLQERTEPGVAGRFTYNINRTLALEAQLNFFPRRENLSDLNNFGLRPGGRVLQVLFGVKAGKRFAKFGFFAKARPGFVSFGESFKGTEAIEGLPIRRETERLTHFAFDLGGVVEYYASRRTLVRFDIGDTIIRYRAQTLRLFGTTVQQSGATRHNLQMSIGFGFRF